MPERRYFQATPPVQDPPNLIQVQRNSYDSFLKEGLKELFEEICARHDLNSSQVVRKLVRQYIIDNAGHRELPEWLKPSGKAGD